MIVEETILATQKTVRRKKKKEDTENSKQKNFEVSNIIWIAKALQGYINVIFNSPVVDLKVILSLIFIVLS